MLIKFLNSINVVELHYTFPKNKNTFPIDVIQYGRVKRSGTPKIDGLFILHED